MIWWILGLSAAYAAALNGTMVMPVVVLAISKLPGYDEGLATLVASAELAGIAIYGLFFPRLALKSWRMVTGLGALAIVAGQTASFLLPDPVPLVGARLLAGLGEGAIFSLVAASLASKADAERLWGEISLFGGSAMGLLLFIISIVPQLQAGSNVFLTIALFAAAMAPLFFLITRRAADSQPVSEQAHLDRDKMLAAMGIVFLTYAVQAAQWAICGYVGEQIGLQNSELGIYLAISSLAGFAGAVVPALTTDKGKRLPLVMAGFLIMAVSIYCLFNFPTRAAFITAQILVNVGFYIVTPFVTGIITENDRDGSLVSRTLVIAIIGATLGTAAAGPAFAAWGGSEFAWLCLIPLALGAGGAMVVFGHLHRIRSVVMTPNVAE